MKFLILICTLLFVSCAAVPFEVCNTSGASRCVDTQAEQCAGGHWYPLVDCVDVGWTCAVQEGSAVCVEK